MVVEQKWFSCLQFVGKFKLDMIENEFIRKPPVGIG
jgi:hypothetical protein